MMEEYELLAKSRQITRYNQQNMAQSETGLLDLTQQEEIIKGSELMVLLWEPLPAEERVNDWGVPFNQRMYEACLKRIPVFADAECILVQKGIIVTNAPVRVLPTMQGNYRAGQEPEIDRFAKGRLKLGEGVLIYCSDLSNTWYFVRSRQFYGWVLQRQVALADAYHWEQYQNERSFVQLLESRDGLEFFAGNGCKKQEEVLMGTRLVLQEAGRDYFIVSIPQRNAEGKVYMQLSSIPRRKSWYAGELPLTIQNIRAQASKMLGEPYDWGGKQGYRDCTGLISDLFLVFGVHFAGNSTMQMAQIGVKHLTECYARKDKKLLLQHLLPGTVLYLPGHAMLYLGYAEGKYRILHSVYQLGLKMDDGVLPHKIKRVVTGDLEQLRSDGKAFLEHWNAYWEPGIISCN